MTLPIVEVTKRSTQPWQSSELGQVQSAQITTERIGWGLRLGDRYYIGGAYCPTYSFDLNGNYIARASLPPPRQQKADSSAAFVATPASSGGSIDAATTTTRYYRYCYANEVTALFTSTTDPNGKYGPLQAGSTKISATGFTGSSNKVTLGTINWTVPEEYNITHAYFWASDDEDLGPWYFVGKIAYNATANTWGTLEDTLSNESLLLRRVHPDDILTLPGNVTSACRAGNRMICIVGGALTEFSTDLGVYVNVTNGSREVVLAEDAMGTTHTTARWPRFVEEGGMVLKVSGVSNDKAFETDNVDLGTTTSLFLVTPFEGTTQSGVGLDMKGSEALYCCMANLQGQEQVQAGMILTDVNVRFEGGPLMAVESDPDDETAVFVFTQKHTYHVMGLPPTDLITEVANFTGQARRVSKTFGCAGPLAHCVGQFQGRNVVYVLNTSGLCVVSSSQVETISNDLLRDFFRGFGYPEKVGAQLAYDPTRELVYILLPQAIGTARTAYSSNITGLEGLDNYSLMVVYDTRHNTFAIWNGHWRAIAVATGVADGTSGPGSGAKVMVQVDTGDVEYFDEKCVFDGIANTATQGGPFAWSGALTVVSTSVARIGSTVSAYTRGNIVMAVDGTARGSWAYVTGRNSNGDGWDHNGWSNGTPAIGDTVVYGAIHMQYQTGMLALEDNVRFQERVRAFRFERKGTISDSTFRLRGQLFASDVDAQEPDRYTPSTEHDFTKDEIDSRMWLPVGMVAASPRVAVGIDVIQPSNTSENASPYRFRLRTWEVDIG